jgi:hypothetical protein
VKVEGSVPAVVATEEKHAHTTEEDAIQALEPVATEQPAMVAASPDQRVFLARFDLEPEDSSHEDLDVPAFMRQGGM